MKHSSESTMRRVTYASGKIFSLFVILFCVAGVVSMLMQLFELKWRWLQITDSALFVMSMLSLTISWVTPGILIIFGVPWLAYAWFQGINTSVVQSKPWEQLSGFQKFSIYFWAIFVSGFTVLTIIAFILHTF